MHDTGLLPLVIITLILLAGSNMWFLLRVLRPVRRLSNQARQLSQGEMRSFDQACGGVVEIRDLQRAMAGMVGHVRRSQEHSRAYADQLADGQENERKRIAQELHDDTIQSLIAITQSIEMAKNWVENDPERAQQMLSMARQQAVESVSNLRNLIGDLRPPALEELGLIAALQMQIEKMKPLKTELKIEGIPRRIEETRELALFRAAQEALNNAVRHSQAKEARVCLSFKPDGLKLEVRDNGRGFAPPAHLSELANKHHYGLLGMHERISGLGGSVGISSQPGQGTIVSIMLPSNEADQPGHLVRDPVCSAMIESHRAYGSLFYRGETHYFCCPVCQGAFKSDPEFYLQPDTQNPASQS